MKTIDLLFYIILGCILYKIINVNKKKENFQLSTGIITDRTLLDPTKFYDVGTIKQNVNPTATPGINSTVTCSFPTTIYRLSATVNPVCATNQESNYTFGTTPQLGSALRV
jgi:hypothetical protein